MREMKTVSVPCDVLIRRSPRNGSACPARLQRGFPARRRDGLLGLAATATPNPDDCVTKCRSVPSSRRAHPC
jgi:hypothetical protein